MNTQQTSVSKKVCVTNTEKVLSISNHEFGITMTYHSGGAGDRSPVKFNWAITDKIDKRTVLLFDENTNVLQFSKEYLTQKDVDHFVARHYEQIVKVLVDRFVCGEKQAVAFVDSVIKTTFKQLA